ncbi:hypothetical protein CN910_29490 [Bacillus cereus]|uniref:hypothetical protein n=1 Tax=Bacillus cereus TaxID=1396 RepID=UPI000BFE5957|nr:hypothetical protein [Bacillus cereus]PGK87148.1 hypothetical protein CN910_29490 [Bacillus cereus]
MFIKRGENENVPYPAQNPFWKILDIMGSFLKSMNSSNAFLLYKGHVEELEAGEKSGKVKWTKVRKR